MQLVKVAQNVWHHLEHNVYEDENIWMEFQQTEANALVKEDLLAFSIFYQTTNFPGVDCHSGRIFDLLITIHQSVQNRQSQQLKVCHVNSKLVRITLSASEKTIK